MGISQLFDIHFGSHFYRFQSMVIWFHQFKPVITVSTWKKQVEEELNSLHQYLQKLKREERSRSHYLLKGHTQMPQLPYSKLRSQSNKPRCCFERFCHPGECMICLLLPDNRAADRGGTEFKKKESPSTSSFCLVIQAQSTLIIL